MYLHFIVIQIPFLTVFNGRRQKDNFITLQLLQLSSAQRNPGNWEKQLKVCTCVYEKEQQQHL